MTREGCVWVVYTLAISYRDINTGKYSGAFIIVDGDETNVASPTPIMAPGTWSATGDTLDPKLKPTMATLHFSKLHGTWHLGFRLRG